MAEPQAEAKAPVLDAFLRHGGDLDAARAAFPDAPEPWIDLSTGINPWPYPLPPVPPDAWTRLPTPKAEAALRAAAAAAYGAPSPEHVAAAPGSQALIQLLPRLFPGKARVAVLGPTYAEHARCWALAGHEALEVAEPVEADVVVVVNPNNPDGRTLAPDALLALAARQAARGGWLVVDEAFADVVPGASVAPFCDRPGLVVLRSFGKAYGLAGLRLGFLLAEPGLALRTRESVGPWAVAGPGLSVARTALSDVAWMDAARRRLAGGAARLDAILEAGGLVVVGGTPLFRLAEAGDAAGVSERLGRAGLLVRPFVCNSRWLRFGLPVDRNAEHRLAKALGSRQFGTPPVESRR